MIVHRRIPYNYWNKANEVLMKTKTRYEINDNNFRINEKQLKALRDNKIMMFITIIEKKNKSYNYNYKK